MYAEHDNLKLRLLQGNAAAASSQQQQQPQQPPPHHHQPSRLAIRPDQVTLTTPLQVLPNTALYMFIAVATATSSTPSAVGNSVLVESKLGSCCFTYLGTILPLIKKFIKRFQLFDVRNPSIVLCNQVLERVLNRKALHVSQIKAAVLESTSLGLVNLRNHSSPAPATTNPTPRREESIVSDDALNTTPSKLIIVEDNEDERDSGAEDVLPTTTVCPATTSIKRETASPPPSPTVQPAAAAAAHHRLYHVSGPLRRLLNLPTDGPVAFATVSEQMSRYILSRRQQLFDPRNVEVAIVSGDPLGQVFGGIKAFHRSQVTYFIHQHLRPAAAAAVGGVAATATADESCAVSSSTSSGDSGVEDEDECCGEEARSNIKQDDNNNAEEIREAEEASTCRVEIRRTEDVCRKRSYESDSTVPFKKRHLL